MNQKNNKENIEEIMKSPGKCLGEVIRSTFAWIKKTKGQEALDKFEKEMKNLGYPASEKTIKPFGWYPVGLRALNFIALRRAFGWKEKEIEKLGEDLLDYSLVLKMILRFIMSLKDIFKNSDKYWRKHFSTGRMKTHEFDEGKKYSTVRIYDFKIHPDFCPNFLGYFKRLVALGGKKNVTVRETRCMFKGDPYHEYLIKWE